MRSIEKMLKKWYPYRNEFIINPYFLAVLDDFVQIGLNSLKLWKNMIKLIHEILKYGREIR